MKLTNFEFKSGVELSGLGNWWDLHNGADYVGLELSPADGSALMRWRVMTESPQRELGFSPTNPARSCAIRFDGITAILVRRDVELGDPRNAGTLEDVRMVVPLEPNVLAQIPADVLRRGIRHASHEEGAHMLFTFMDGLDVEIAAEKATLVADGQDRAPDGQA